MVSDINKKYFFDHNNFDDPSAAEGMEEVVVEARVFNEAEMAIEVKKAYQEGYNKASDDMRESQAQHLNATMDTLNAAAAALAGAEKLRQSLFDREIVALSRAAFEHIYPFYAKNIGFDALVLALSDTLQSHKSCKGLVIHCAPDLVADVEATLKSIRDTNPDLAFSVHGDDELSLGACRLAWERGGMVHDPDEMAAEIVKILQDGLAGTPSTSHDDGDSVKGEAGESNE